MGRKRKYDIICGIYKITNTKNGKVYIGQSKNIHRRFLEHQSIKYRNCCVNKALYKAINKYGIQNFKFEIIEQTNESKLDEREIYWIKYYQSYEKGYNCTRGGKDVNFTPRIDIECTFETSYDAMCYICDIYNIEKEDYFNESIENMSPQEVFDYSYGMETLLNDFCDGYNSFDDWADCNLI